jgi:hypothetical protein
MLCWVEESVNKLIDILEAAFSSCRQQSVGYLFCFNLCFVTVGAEMFMCMYQSVIELVM